MSLSWKWPCVLTLCTCATCVVYFKLDPRTLVWFGLRFFFKFAITIFCLQLVITQIYQRWFKYRQSHTQTEGDQKDEENYSVRRNQIREETQVEHDEKACSYKKRILIPREEEKKRKKEEEFLQFTGPAWKGRGDKLGGEDERATQGSGERPGDESRDIRRLPESVLLHIPRVEPVRTKRVIKLPDEPNPDTKDITTIVLRTPLGTNHKRRFLNSCTLQVVMDYMTTLGFKEKLYTLSTSYPRRQLTDCVDQTLTDLDLGMKVLLNIEEI